MRDENSWGTLTDDPFLASFDRGTPAMYLGLALVLTGLLCVLTAPFFAPDEANQACRAIELSHGGVIPRMGPLEAGAEIDAGAAGVMDGMSDIRMRWEKHTTDFLDRPYGSVPEELQRRLAGVRWAGRTTFVGFGNTAMYPPGLYLPAMLGWRVGEAANLTIFASLRLARLLCALTAVVLGWLALRLCACSRWMLFPFFLLPSTLFLNASCSQDAVLLPVAGLVAAVLSRPLVACRLFTPRELTVAATLLALCGMARPPYAALALVLFLPSVELPKAEVTGLPTKVRDWFPAAAAFCAIVAACAVWCHLVSPLGLDASDEADPELQAIFLRWHPVAASWAVLKGTGGAAIDFLRRGVYVIGWNDLLPHHGAAVALGACLAVILILAPGCPIRTWKGFVLLALATAAPLLGISLAEYILWTPPGSPAVYGVQPRYWLPVMPFAILLVQGRLRWPRRLEGLRIAKVRTGLLVGATVLLACIACTLPWMTAHAFYREGVSSMLRLNLQ